MMKKPKILVWDVEVSRDIVAGYGNKWEFKVVKTIRHQELMSFAYKWLGEKKVTFVSRHDFATYKEFVQSMWDLLDEADITIAHNGNRFDNKMANRFFVKEGFGPVSPYKSIDTLQVARGTFKFQSNSLRDLLEFFGLAGKESITYADLEDDFMSDNPSARTKRLMKKYNIRDVTGLEELYLIFRPYIKNHPNLGDFTQLDGVCPVCLSPDVTPYGSAARRNGRVIAYRCNNCGHRSNENTIKKTGGRLVNA